MSARAEVGYISVLSRKGLSWDVLWSYPGSFMARRRQIRRTGRRLAITIPKNLADLYEVEEGDQAEFEPLAERAFRIKLIKIQDG